MLRRAAFVTLTSLALAAASFSASAQSFSNTTPIIISSESTTASPYPSNILVSGVAGDVEAVTVTLNGLTQPDSHALDVMVVGPYGQQVILMSQAGWLQTGPTNATLTFSATASSPLTHYNPVVTGSWLPSDHDGTDAFPAPAPANAANTDLAIFNGTDANGTWRLFIHNNGSWLPLTNGSLAGGWSLNIVAEVTTTCASEGYKGAQLTWCKNICENGLTGQVLDTWIHRWINRYRDLPYCAVEEENQPK